jgi:hypothetical protein
MAESVFSPAAEGKGEIAALARKFWTALVGTTSKGPSSCCFRATSAALVRGPDRPRLSAPKTQGGAAL